MAEAFRNQGPGGPPGGPGPMGGPSGRGYGMMGPRGGMGGRPGPYDRMGGPMGGMGRGFGPNGPGSRGSRSFKSKLTIVIVWLDSHFTFFKCQLLCYFKVLEEAVTMAETLVAAAAADGAVLEALGVLTMLSECVAYLSG